MVDTLANRDVELNAPRYASRGAISALRRVSPNQARPS